MTIKTRLSLASLILLIAGPIGCSGKEPAGEAVAPAPTVSSGPSPEVAPPTDPAVRPASIEPTLLEKMPVDGLNPVMRKADGDVREISGEIKGQARQAAGEVEDSANQAKADARKMIDRARREARDKARSVEGEVEKDVNDVKKQVVEDLLGNPKD